MASVINSIRNIVTDVLWVPKVLFLSYFVFLILYNFEYLLNHNSAFLALGTITTFMIVGVSAVMINRNINNLTPILPGILSFPEVVLKALISIIIMLPGSVAFYFAFNFMITHPYFEAPVHEIFVFLISLLFMPFIFMPLVFYCARGKFTDVFRFELLLRGSGDFMVKILMYLLQYFFCIYLVSYVIYLALKVLLGEDNSIMYMYYGFITTISILSFFSFISDLYGESIPIVKTKVKKSSK